METGGGGGGGGAAGVAGVVAAAAAAGASLAALASAFFSARLSLGAFVAASAPDSGLEELFPMVVACS